jgi:hypothetical protein
MFKRYGPRVLVVLGVSLPLYGCGNVEYQPIGPNEYLITGRSALGALGGDPSASQIALQASKLCPGGYDVTDKKSWVSEGVVMNWTVRCSGNAAAP